MKQTVMKQPGTRRGRIPGLSLGLAWALFAAAGTPAHACTIFVLTDASRTLFFNNEDWSNPAARIWFVPAGDGHLGCAYVGFDNGWAQGGLNTHGLAFDWVAGFDEQWAPASGLRSVRGNPSERMLETCATVEDAIAFYRTHREPDFARAKILIADRSGASVIIGARDGKLQVEPANRCRGFGYGHRMLDQRLATPPEATVANGIAILRACLQEGQYATKYSDVFDLKTGDIFLFPVPTPTRTDEVKLNLAAELSKGGHYYDLPQIQAQLTQAPRPLLPNQRRFYLDEFKPLSDQEPAIATRLRAVLRDAEAGTMRSDDYTAELWKKLAPAQKAVQAELKDLGGFVSMTLVGRQDEGGQRSFRYLMDFKNARVLQNYRLDGQDKVALIQSEGFESKPKAASAAN